MRTAIHLFIIFTFFTACKEKPSTVITSVNGTWESLGCGWNLKIQDSTNYVLYDVTSISLISNSEGSFDEISESIILQNDTLLWRQGVVTYNFIKIDNLPEMPYEVLDGSKNKDPLHNFDVFAETVKEHYAFLDLNGIDWNEMYESQRERLNANSSDAELYLLIEETLELLNDNHADLDAPDAVYDAIDEITEEDNPSENEVENTLPEYGDFAVAKMVAHHHLEEDMTQDSWLMHWGKLTEDIGYIQVKVMCLYGDLEIPNALEEGAGFVNAYFTTAEEMSEGAYIKKEEEGVQKLMDRVMKDLSDTKSLVVDVRFNGGGQDAVSFGILDFFASERTQVATQKFRYGDKHSPILPLYIEGSKDAYANPVYVLTSQQTGSAAEVFSIATMSMPHIKRIGSPTMGALSTTLDKTLPNGWDFSISNEVYMDNNDAYYENKGIPVDYELNYPIDRQAFFRSVVDDLDSDKKNILNAIKQIELN